MHCCALRVKVFCRFVQLHELETASNLGQPLLSGNPFRNSCKTPSSPTFLLRRARRERKRERRNLEVESPQISHRHSTQGFLSHNARKGFW